MYVKVYFIYKNAHMHCYAAIDVEATSLNILTSQLGEYMQTASLKISTFAFAATFQLHKP